MAGPTGNRGVSFYWGAFTFPSQDSVAPFLGLRQNGRFIDTADAFTWGFDMIDAATGERTGKTIATADISFWSNPDFSDPDVSPLVQIGDEFMGAVNEGRRITFFKLDSDLNALQPDSVGFTAAEFDEEPSLFGDRITQVVPTSYGILGSTHGFVNTLGGYFPHIYAADSSLAFPTPLAKRIDTLNYYPFNPFLIATDSADRFYSAGLLASASSPFTQIDTLAITGYEADASIRYISYIVLPGNRFATNQKMVLNEAQDELLLSGYYIDTANVRAGYLAKINPEDGMVKDLSFFTAEALGYETGQFLSDHWAIYDSAGHVVQALVEGEVSESGAFSYRFRFFETNTAGENREDRIVFTNPTSFSIQNLTHIGESIFASGNWNSFSGLERVAYILNLTPGNPTSIDEEFANEIRANAYPNPTHGPVSMVWEQPATGDYELQLIDINGRTLRSWTGTKVTGPAELQIQVDDIPQGTYFLRLDLDGGAVIKPLVKY